LWIEDAGARRGVRAANRHLLPARGTVGEVGVNRRVTETGLALVPQRSAEAIKG